MVVFFSLLWPKRFFITCIIRYLLGCFSHPVWNRFISHRILLFLSVVVYCYEPHFIISFCRCTGRKKIYPVNCKPLFIFQAIPYLHHVKKYYHLYLRNIDIKKIIKLLTCRPCIWWCTVGLVFSPVWWGPGVLAPSLLVQASTGGPQDPCTRSQACINTISNVPDPDP